VATTELTLAQARRVALAAQGFGDARPTGPVTRRHLRRVVARTGLLQVDSVNVLKRAHYLPLFSRLGAYPDELLDRAVYRRPRDLFEYWGHEASLIPVELQPYLRWRMAEAHVHAWGRMRSIARDSPEVVRWVLDEVRDRGPVAAGEIELDVPNRAKDQWGWNWSDAKAALEWLFWTGEVTTASRNSGFARLYDLTERVLPAAIVHTPTPDEPDAVRELLRVSARGLGVAAEVELRDYFRLPVAGFRRALAELVEEGTLLPVTVRGWRPRTYLFAEARVPRSIRTATLLSPFDPLIWERSRTERLFDFHYRIGIYTPPEQRTHGYYALPFLLGERLVARVDLKADRRSGVLLVPGVWGEPGIDTGEVAMALATHLGELAAWLGLDTIGRPELGDLAAPLAAALRPRRIIAQASAAQASATQASATQASAAEASAAKPLAAKPTGVPASGEPSGATVDA
jgi:uncharacterized protein YcaQ